MAVHVRNARRRRRIYAAPRPRIFRDRSNPLEDLPEDEINRRFRFRPDTILYVFGILPELSSRARRNAPLPPLLQLLVTLRFLATGAFHLLIGDSLNVSRATDGRCIKAVTSAISSLAVQCIRFPSGDNAVSAKRAFEKVAGFPNVLGCIDCTQMRIQRPHENEGDFVNRKGSHSLNVQMTCDADYKVTSLVAAWPGSVHDSMIFRTQNLCIQFEQGQHDGFLLGDSGYPCRVFLMVPFFNARSEAEEKFNRALCRTRVMIEQTFGILKRRLSVLHVEMRTTPHVCVSHICACVVLHNIGINMRDILREEPVQDDEDNPQPCMQVMPNGAAMKDHTVRSFFPKNYKP